MVSDLKTDRVKTPQREQLCAGVSVRDVEAYLLWSPFNREELGVENKVLSVLAKCTVKI